MLKRIMIYSIMVLTLVLLFIVVGCGTGDKGTVERFNPAAELQQGALSSGGTGSGGGGGAYRCMVDASAYGYGIVCAGDTTMGMTLQDCQFVGGTWEAGVCQ